MAKFCGKCGAKLDVTTGLCPNCDVDKLKKQSDKSEAVDVAKSIQEIAPTSEKPLSKKEAKKKRKADKKAAKKAKKKEKWTSMTFGQKVFIIILKFLLWLIILISFSIGIIGGLSYLDIIEIPVVTAYREDKLLEFINTKNANMKNGNALKKTFFAFPFVNRFLFVDKLLISFHLLFLPN